MTPLNVLVWIVRPIARRRADRVDFAGITERQRQCAALRHTR